MTVNKALNKLVEENVVYRVPRKGTYVRHNRCIALLFLSRATSLSLPIPPVFSGLIHGIEQALRQRDHTMIFHRSSYDGGINTDYLRNHVDGIIFVGTDECPRFLEELKDFPCVRAMGIPMYSPFFSEVSYDNRATGILAGDYLLNCGCTHPLLVQSTSENQCYSERGDSFISRISDGGGKTVVLAPDGVGGHQENMEFIRAGLAGISDNYPGVDSIFCTSTWLLPLIYEELYKVGLTPEKDLKVISCDRDNIALASLKPVPAVVDTKTEQIGEEAVQVLLDMVANPVTGKRVVILQPGVSTPDKLNIPSLEYVVREAV